MLTPNEPQSGQTIEQLKKRYENLNETRIKVQAQHESAAQQLEQLRKTAIDQFGTDDIEQLQARLAEMIRLNEQQRAEYESSLDAIEARLEQIDLQASQEPLE